MKTWMVSLMLIAVASAAQASVREDAKRMRDDLEVLIDSDEFMDSLKMSATISEFAVPGEAGGYYFEFKRPTTRGVYEGCYLEAEVSEGSVVVGKAECEDLKQMPITQVQPEMAGREFTVARVAPSYRSLRELRDLLSFVSIHDGFKKLSGPSSSLRRLSKKNDEWTLLYRPARGLPPCVIGVGVKFEPRPGRAGEPAPKFRILGPARCAR